MDFNYSPEDIQRALHTIEVPSDRMIGLLDDLKRYADECLAHSPKSISPVVHILAVDAMSNIGEDPEMEEFSFLLDCDFTEYGDKLRTMARIAGLLVERKRIPVAVSLLSEAWRSYQSPDQNEGYHGPASGDPNKEEILMASCLTLNPRNCLVQDMVIDRDDDGSMRVVKTWGKLMKSQHPNLLRKLYRYAAFLMAKAMRLDMIPDGMNLAHLIKHDLEQDPNDGYAY